MCQLSDHHIRREKIIVVQLIEGKRKGIETEPASVSHVTRWTNAEKLVLLSFQASALGVTFLTRVSRVIIDKAFCSQPMIIANAEIIAIIETQEMRIVLTQ